MSQVNPNAAPAAAPTPSEPEVKKGVNGVEEWPTQDKATEVANGRQKGARFAFQVTEKGKDKPRFFTATHRHFLYEKLATDSGTVVTEVGKPEKGPKPITPESVMASLNSLPPAERAAVLEQLKKLKP